ncbi:diguanylate cyclase [Duganella sp. LX20W]|uniref:diguanylate cyclase n=1 Tax=Rugamonas brunnea TaxID=2758569 RepID=A0A7W2ERH7_9BURK|nr:GGDEF domain-containing protein [Rugamonas brunnea]MBA5637297.1 diguanylate cyclase [Rugamonas brunnea]
MRLTRMFAVSMAILALLVGAMLGRILWGEWNSYRAARAGLHALQLVQRGMVAAEKLSFERGPVNAVMGDAVPADPTKRARLAAARAASDQALAALAAALADPRTNEDGRPRTVTAIAARLAAARAAVDAVADLPPGQRTPQRLTAAVEGMFALIPMVLDDVTGYAAAAEQAYPNLAKILMKARFAVELREYAGRLGSRLTVALASGQPLAETEHTQILFLRGQIEQLRHLIVMSTSAIDRNPRVLAALRTMDEGYFTSGLALVTGVERDSRAHQPYGMDTAQFAQRYVPFMTPILAVRDVLLEAALDQARQDYETAQHELLLACLTGAAILLAMTLLMIMLRARVMVPLARATRALVKLGNGDFSIRVHETRRQDEIGDLLRALGQLRAAGLEKQQLELERQRLIEELRLRADTDYLTGILNRRAFTAAGNQRLRRAREHKLALAVILFDVDRFKAVNDSHGHDAGDQVLIRIAALAREELRDGEILARYGGEEFVIMPGNCDLQGASAVAERMRRAIEAAPLTLSNGHVLHVTASFGVAASEGPHLALDSLFHAADLALYRAKHQGRNRVECEPA